MGNSSFMPFFHIFSHMKEIKEFDIWDDSGEVINLTKLCNFFEPVIIHRERTKDKDLRMIKRMKRCLKNDFEKRGAHVPEDFSDTEYFLCPDW